MSPSVARLIVLQDETPLKTIFVSDTPVLIGRSERVQVSVNDPQASRMHAVLWLENGRLWIQDLNSTNGTMLDGRRLEGIESIRQDAELRVGETRIRLEPIAHVQPILWMETIGGEQSWPLDARTHTIGPDNDADIRLDGAPASQLVVRDDGVTMLHVGSRRLPLTLQRSFRLGVLTLRLRRARAELGSTVPEPHELLESQGAPYRIRSRTAQNAPERAILEELNGERRCEIRAGNRIALLFSLARQLHTDRTRRLPPADQGWCRDDEVGAQIWGRQWWNYDNNRLHVLLHRTRRELEAAGFDPGCLQKARGRMRFWIREVDLPDESETRTARG